MNVIMNVFAVIILSSNYINGQTTSSPITSTISDTTIESTESSSTVSNSEMYAAFILMGAMVFFTVIICANRMHNKFQQKYQYLYPQLNADNSLIGRTAIPQNKKQSMVEDKAHHNIKTVIDKEQHTEKKQDETNENKVESKSATIPNTIILEEISNDDTGSDKNEGNDGDRDTIIDVPSVQIEINETMLIEETEENKMESASPITTQDTGFRIQIEQLPEFETSYKWILDKQRNVESIASEKTTVKQFTYNKKLWAKKRVTLTNTHNFTWFTSIIQGSLKSAEQESEITRCALDKVLNLLPIPFRNRIWEICNIDNDTFIVSEDYKEFVDALLIATGQYRINMDEDEEMVEFRDMSDVFYQIINIDQLFKEKKNTSNKISKTTLTLSTMGATKLILALRNLDSVDDIPASDIGIPLLTGFTKKAIRHSVTYCTMIYWKILTNVWWDEDDEDDTALPQTLDAYNTKKHYRKRSKISHDVRHHLSNTSMDDLFPNLYNNKIFHNEEDEESDEESEDDGNKENIFLHI